MKRPFRRLLRLILLSPLIFIAVTVLWVAALKYVNVPFTPLMVRRAIEFRAEEGFKTHYHWVPLEQINPTMVKAVMSSEDNLFPKHDGFDRKAIQKAIEEHKAGKRQRGGSTISQQTAKNVFTRGKSTWVRKGFEAYFTVLIEKIWGKERIMEVYLNIAEMGKGVFGVEAASQIYFHKSAAKLTRREACLIAAVLPSPIKRNAGNPSKYVSSRATAIAWLIPKISYPDWINRKKN